MSSYTHDLADHHAFLLDGFIPRTDRVLILVGDDADLQRAVARRLFEDGADWLPTRGSDARLQELDVDAILAATEDEFRSALADFAAADQWLVLETAERCIYEGAALQAILATWSEEGDIPMIVAMTTTAGFEQFEADAPRILALSTVADLADGTRLNPITLVLDAEDRHDTGWTLMVRCVLDEPTGEPRTAKTPEEDRAVGLVDKFQLVEKDGLAKGFLISLNRGALSLSQFDVARRSAEIVAGLQLGRPLVGSEHIEIARAVYYS